MGSKKDNSGKQMRAQKRKEEQRLMEEKDELARRKYIASTQGMGYRSLLTNIGGLKGLAKKLSGEKGAA